MLSHGGHLRRPECTGRSGRKAARDGKEAADFRQERGSQPAGAGGRFGLAYRVAVCWKSNTMVHQIISQGPNRCGALHDRLKRSGSGASSWPYSCAVRAARGGSDGKRASPGWRRRRHLGCLGVCSVGCTTRILPMSEVALSRRTGKPGIGDSRVVSTAPFLPTSRTSRPRGTITVIAPMSVWTTISTSESSNWASLKSMVTAPGPVRIFVSRLTCQRPSTRTSPMEVEISSGSWRRRVGEVNSTGGGRLRTTEARSASVRAASSPSRAC